MNNILELNGITKKYPGVLALDHVSMSFLPGEVHAIVGENGAGKSTMIKVIAGAIQPNEGTVTIDGKTFQTLNPMLSKENGIGVVYQELNLIPGLSVAENVFFGDRVGGRFVVDFKEMRRRTVEIFQELGADIDPDVHVETLSTAQQQLVEIAKTVVKNCKVLIMDEPSASIAVADVENLFRIIGRLKQKGVTILYISHRLDEIFQITDRVSIMRDGHYIATHNTSEITRADMIRLMVGRELTESYPSRNTQIGQTVLELKNVTGNGDRDLSLSLRRGEILGIGGLVGSGRTEMAEMIYGAEKISSGEILLDGKPVQITEPSKAIEYGIGLIPEDRKNKGCLLNYTINWNISFMSLKRMSKLFGYISAADCSGLSQKYVEHFAIKTPSLEQMVRNLSGGNQQKVVVAKVLAAQTKIIIFDEPTRGIDVAAKQEIYKLMNALVAEGCSILMITSEMEELLGMSDRIVVLHEGSIAGSLEREVFSQDAVLALASGLKG